MANPNFRYRILSRAFGLSAFAALGLMVFLNAGIGFAASDHTGLTGWEMPSVEYVIVVDRDPLYDLLFSLDFETLPPTALPEAPLVIEPPLAVVVTVRGDVSDEPMSGAWGHGADPPQLE